MKKLIFATIVTSLLLLSAQGYAADDATAMRDRAATLQLTGFEAKRAMLEYCGVDGDEADKILANDIAATDALEASLSDEAKKNLRAELAHARAAVKASWEATPSDQRDKACEALVAQMSR
ncbi:MAG: hypothetical protein ACAH80_14225 [Alphaproteobacteria bacterium]